MATKVGGAAGRAAGGRYELVWLGETLYCGCPQNVLSVLVVVITCVLFQLVRKARIKCQLVHLVADQSLLWEWQGRDWSLLYTQRRVVCK